MILSIESSCDDSSIAITKIDTLKVVFHKKISQELDHSVYGGVVPELAARLHAKALPDILEQTSKYFPHIKAIAVTNEPGLSVTLVEGVTMAKALSIALHVPIIAVNHLKGHIYSLFIEKKSIFPLGVLLVSGGHTQVLHVKSHEEIEILASTLDDSFGESFDKVSKMLDLGYPGGPVIEQYAKNGNSDKYDFTIPLANSPKIAFSYSGLKNQVRLCIEENKANLNEKIKSDICASFQKVAVAHLVQKLKKIFKSQKFENFAVVGGASANLYLREKLLSLHKNLLTAPLEFCSDNAVMIGRASIKDFKNGKFCQIDDIGINPKISFYM